MAEAERTNALGNGVQEALHRVAGGVGGSSETVFLLPATLQSLKEGSQSSFTALHPLLGIVLIGSATLRRCEAGGMRRRYKVGGT